MTKRYALAMLGFCWALAACTQERQPCLTPKIATLLMKSMRPAANGAVVDTALPAAVLIPLNGGADLVGQFFGRTSNFSLSLSPVADSCRWILLADTASTGGLQDTLTFTYSKERTFLSNACGYAYVYQLTNVTSSNNMVDSLKVNNTLVNNNVNTTHVQVYIHPNF